MQHFRFIVEIIAVIGASASVSYFLLAVHSARSFLHREPTAVPPQFPPVSILKPLKGTDPEMYDSFRSHCVQNYPDYQIIFGVSDPHDPALADVERMKREFPRHHIGVMVCEEVLGTNIKVSNLVQMMRSARHDYIVVNDSDIRVAPDYLQSVIAPLTRTDTGLVTCLYRAVAGSTIGSKLEAIGISTDFAPGVLVARQLEGIRFGLGSTLAFRRETLDAIGGFESLLDYLADDYELGKRIAAKHLRIELASSVVETYLPAYKFLDFMRHQIRWGRTIRDSRPGGHFGLVFTFGLFWALLALIISGWAAWAWALLAVTTAARFASAIIVGGNVLRDTNVVRRLWLIPVRDLIAVVVWAVSLVGHKVQWRGDWFILRKGKLARI